MVFIAIYIGLDWVFGISYLCIVAFVNNSYFIFVEKSTNLFLAFALDFTIRVAQFQLELDILEELALIITEYLQFAHVCADFTIEFRFLSFLLARKMG